MFIFRKKFSRFIRIRSISPNDGYGFCECELCKKLDPQPWTSIYANPNLSDRMWDFAQGIFGDAFGNVIEQLIQKMDENPDWMRNDDIPPEWLPVLNSATWNQKQNGSANENGITRQDLAGFNALPGNIRQAVENGARKGVSGIQVSLDGFRIGQLVAPYVSEMIARDFIV